ncbi:unnamed protein product, partial [marine sediment metagenome]
MFVDINPIVINIYIYVNTHILYTENNQPRIINS